MITVDGDTSTNDMVLVMANQQVDHQTLNQNHPQWETFVDALLYILAKARDGEGATKLISVNVSGAKSISDARKIGKTIKFKSSKISLFWRRCQFRSNRTAIGYSGCEIDPTCIYSTEPNTCRG